MSDSNCPDHPSSKAEPEPEAEGGSSAEASDLGSLVELVLAEAPRRPDRIDGVVVGRLSAFAADGTPLVTFPEGPDEPIPARAAAPLEASDVGRELALMFEGARPDRPIVMGKMFAPAVVTAEHPATTPVMATQDGERLEFSAEKEIVLRCGRASITLTRAGKVLIRGAYLSSRSSGLNRIQGGSVEIN